MSELNERLLLASIISPNKLMYLKDRQIRADDFIFHKSIFEFIIKYFAKYENIPTQSVIETNFPDWKIANPDPDALDYYIDELKKSSLERKVSKTIEENIEQIHSDPEKAIQEIIDKFSKLQNSTEKKVSFTDRDALERLNVYEERRLWRSKGLMVGIPTGLKYFDEKGEGWQFGNFVTVLGTSYVGKSWMLTYFATRAYQAGYKVLMVSCEMTTEEQEIRFDSLMAPLLGYKLPYFMLKNGGGNLSDDYFKYLKEISSRDYFITVDASGIENFEISSITQLVDIHKPDIVLIDGMEMLQDKMAKNRQGWEEVKAIVRQAKMCATSRNVVVIATAQSKSTAAERMPKLKDTAYSFDVARASDIVIALTRDITESEDESKLRAFSVPKERNSTGHVHRMKLWFDPGNGDIRELSDEI